MSEEIVQRHSRYFQDFVIFKVENVLFKVPKGFLTRDSSLFETLFSCPPGSENPEGASEDKPIVLPEVKVEEFETIMDFYHEWMDPTSLTRRVLAAATPQKASSNSRFAKDRPLTKRLFTLLSISTRLLFDNIRELILTALEQPGALSSFSSVERILLARKYDVDRWLKPAYIDLCRRPEPLEKEDVEALGLDTVLLMARARENYFYRKGTKDEQRSRWLSGSTQDEDKQLAEDAVVEVFFPNSKPDAATGSAVKLPTSLR
ncbi:hypothetical protein NMY22_g9802 [Coprinellus aureogranulatus]|nr:hypothetical protein NMY22_g9802 [Coprinellus aureogranulatus]